MPSIVRDLPSFVTTSTATGTTPAIGHLDDASSITIFVASSAGVSTSSGISIQISQFDPLDPLPQVGVTQSTAFYTVSSSTLTSSAGSNAVAVLSNISFRGLRLVFANSSASVAGEVVAFASKQINVGLPLAFAGLAAAALSAVPYLI